MSNNIDQLTDAQLSECFAVEVAGWHDFRNDPDKEWWEDADGTPSICVDPFATSADAVLPWLEKRSSSAVTRSIECYRSKDGYLVQILTRSVQSDTWAFAPTFARAACIALIRAKRASK